MNKGFSILGGIGLGAAMMYIFDPDRGNRRRALVRDRVSHGMRVTNEAIDVAVRDTQNRARGVSARVSSMLSRKPVTDQVLEQRIRAQLGRVVDHPGSIEVRVENGQVTLTGPVMAKEVKNLMGAIWKMRGVKDVRNMMEAHEWAENVPGLQGGSNRNGARSFLKRESWTPAERLLIGATGATVTLFNLRRHPVFALLGMGLVARAASNRKLKDMVNVRARRPLEVHRSITVQAPVDDVYQFWTNFENFPRFMRNVKEVARTDERHSHWKVAGPAGSTVEWDSVITEQEPNQVIAWRTEPGSTVEHRGSVRFVPEGLDSTRLELHMNYNPPAGSMGRSVAALFGAHPERELDEDLARMRGFFEGARGREGYPASGLEPPQPTGGIGPGLGT